MKLARRLDRRAALRNARRSAVKGQIRRGLLAERLEERSLLAGDVLQSAYFNWIKPTDVNNDDYVAPNDALDIINMLNAGGSMQLPQPIPGAEGESGISLYVDVDNDGYISPNDALTVINALNAEGAPPDLNDIVEYQLLALQPGTDIPITTVQVGQDFDFAIYVQDLRTDGDANRGVFSAYLDLFFDKTLAQPRVAEIQTVAVTGAANSRFRLSLDGVNTADIQLPPGAASNSANRETVRNAIQTALNTALGAGTVLVVPISTNSYNYSVQFVGRYDQNLNKMTSLPPTSGTASNVTISDASDNVSDTLFQPVDGDITNPTSFKEAFRSRGLNLDNGLPGPYQKDISANNAAFGVDELGAFAPELNPANIGANILFEVVRVRMTAVLPAGQDDAQLVFRPDFGLPNVPSPEDDTHDNINRPAHNTLTYANVEINPPEITFVDPGFIAFNELTVTINSGPINARPDTLSFAEDELNAALRTVDVLANDEKNPGAPAGALQVISFTQPATGGTVERVNTGDLTNGNLRFIPTANFNGTTSFTYNVGIVGDSNVATVTVSVDISAVNDAPDITGPAAQNVPEGIANTTINFAANAFAVSDVDVGGGDMTLTLTEGSAAFSQITLLSPGTLVVTGNGTNTVTATGTLADITAALSNPQNVRYVNTSQVGGSFSLQATISDLGNTGPNNLPILTDSVTVAINITSVNDAPTVTAPGNVAVAFVDTLTFNGANAITVADVDTNNLTVTLAVTGGVGTLAASPVGAAQVTGSGTTNLTITGSPTDITNTLAGMVLTPVPGTTTPVSGNIAISVSDGGPTPATANIIVNVIPPNLPFAINDTPNNLVEGSASYTIDVLANDLTNDPANRDPILIDFTQPMRGGQPVGTVTLDPGPTGSASDDQLVFNVPGGDTNFFTPPGQEITFTYTMNEGPTSGGPDATGTVTIRIANQADNPIATDDNYATTLNTPLTISDVNEGVLRRGTDDSTIDNNFGDPNFATLTVLIDASNPATRTTSQGGTVTINANGTFVYTPQTGDIGNDTFTYQAVSSAGGVSAAATVTIKIASPPIATNDSFTVLEQGNPAVSGNVLTGGPGTADDDTDPTELQTLTAVNLVQTASTADGTVTLNPNGDFSYTPEPNQNFFGTVTFTYQAMAADGRLSNVATVTLTVQEVNDPPTAVNDTFTAVRQQSGIGIDQPVPVLGNDSTAPDVGETLVVTGIGLSAGGPFSAGPTTTSGGGSVKVVNGQILYTSPTTLPPGGDDSFFYQITDRVTGGLTASARVDVEVVDFVPKTIGGTVYVDSNNNGSLDVGETPLAGVTVRLTGSSFDNQSVSLTATTDQQGRYVFPQKPNEPGVVDSNVFLKPPSAAGYTITEIDPFGLLSGIDSNSTGNSLVTNSNPFDNTFVARWDVTDSSGNITGLNFGEVGVDMRPVSEGGTLANTGGFKNEFLASSGENGFVLAIDLSGNLMWNWTLDDPDTISVAWANAKSIHVVLSADLTTLTLTVRDGQNQTFVRTLTQGFSIPGSTARFRVLGTGTGGQFIIRIDASANGPGDGLGMTLLAAAPAAMAGAEGEAPVNQNFADNADAVFAGGAWA